MNLDFLSKTEVKDYLSVLNILWWLNWWRHQLFIM